MRKIKDGRFDPLEKEAILEQAKKKAHQTYYDHDEVVPIKTAQSDEEYDYKAGKGSWRSDAVMEEMYGEGYVKYLEPEYSDDVDYRWRLTVTKNKDDGYHYEIARFYSGYWTLEAEGENSTLEEAKNEADQFVIDREEELSEEDEDNYSSSKKIKKEGQGTTQCIYCGKSGLQDNMFYRDDLGKYLCKEHRHISTPEIIDKLKEKGKTIPKNPMTASKKAQLEGVFNLKDLYIEIDNLKKELIYLGNQYEHNDVNVYDRLHKAYEYLLDLEKALGKAADLDMVIKMAQANVDDFDGDSMLKEAQLEWSAEDFQDKLRELGMFFQDQAMGEKDQKLKDKLEEILVELGRLSELAKDFALLKKDLPQKRVRRIPPNQFWQRKNEAHLLRIAEGGYVPKNSINDVLDEELGTLDTKAHIERGVYYGNTPDPAWEFDGDVNLMIYIYSTEDGRIAADYSGEENSELAGLAAIDKSGKIVVEEGSQGWDEVEDVVSEELRNYAKEYLQKEAKTAQESEFDENATVWCENCGWTGIADEVETKNGFYECPQCGAEVNVPEWEEGKELEKDSMTRGVKTAQESGFTFIRKGNDGLFKMDADGKLSVYHEMQWVPTGKKIKEGMSIEEFRSKRENNPDIKINPKIPSLNTIEKWENDGISKTPDGCTVEPDGTCPHGWDSWMKVMGLI